MAQKIKSLRMEPGALQRAIFNSANFSSIATDAKGVIQIFNVGAERMLGYAAADVMNKITPADISDPQEVISRAKALSVELGTPITPGFEALVFKASRGIEDIYELTYIRKDGSRFPAIVSVTALRDAQNAIIGYLLIGTDNTARKQAEFERNKLRAQTQLAQSQKMESVGRLAGGVAHDFNNLLTAIGGYSQFLLDSLPADDKRRDDVEQIKKAGERAASLTRQLLAFSRQQVLETKVLDCNALVADLEKMLRRILGEDVELSTILAPALGRIKADQGQIEQVILNLVINARDAMPKGGTITIETSNVDLRKEYVRMHLQIKPGSYVMFAVADTGTGMDSKTLSHLFEPFFTTKEQGKGTGLGLATVYGIVKQSGGGIYAFSELGHGTTFKVYLPRVDEAVRRVGPSPVPRESFVGEETILLVEDDELVRKFLHRVLLRNGYTVLVAQGPREAIHLSEQHKTPIHLILTDVIMPQMHGPDLVRRLSPLHPESKVIYMSGYTDTTVAHHDLIDSGVPFLQKPLALDVLARKVREVLDRT